MALISPSIIAMTNATLKVAANNYETSVSRIQLTPSVTITTWSGIGGNTLSTSSIPTWVAEISYLQDWETDNSLSRFLLENQGDVVVMDIHPRDGGTGFRVSVTLVPGPIGGDVNAQLVGTVSLQVSGQPEELTTP